MKPPAIHLPSYTAQRDLAQKLWVLGFRFDFIETSVFETAWIEHAGNTYDPIQDHLLLMRGTSISTAYAQWVTKYHKGEYLSMNSPSQFLSYARAFIPNALNQEAI